MNRKSDHKDSRPPPAGRVAEQSAMAKSFRNMEFEWSATAKSFQDTEFERSATAKSFENTEFERSATHF